MISSFLVEVRRARGLTQAQVAEISGIPQPNISAFERGRRMPSAANLHRILDACGFRLAADAGSTVVHARPPALGDPALDQLVADLIDDAGGAAPEPLTAEERATRLAAVLDLASDMVQARGARP